MVISPRELIDFIESTFSEVLSAYEDPDAETGHIVSLADLRLLPGLIEDLRPKPRTTTDQLTLKRLVGRLKGHIKNAETPSYIGGRKSYFPCLDPSFNGRPLLPMLLSILRRTPERELLDDSGVFDYIIDDAYRDSLLADLLETESVLRGGNWKAATVMSGSLIEALLNYSLSYIHAHRGLVQPTNPDWAKIDPALLDKRALSYYINSAQQFMLIPTNLRSILDEARNFRNLVHAGRAKRENASCGKGTGHVAYGALIQLDQHLQDFFSGHGVTRTTAHSP